MAGPPLASSSPERPAKRSRSLCGLDLTNPTDCAVHLVSLRRLFSFAFRKKCCLLSSSYPFVDDSPPRSTSSTTCPSQRRSFARAPMHIKMRSIAGAGAGAPRHRCLCTRPTPRTEPSISNERATRRHRAGGVHPSSVRARGHPSETTPK